MAHESNVPMWRRYARMFGADPRADVDDELQFHLEAKIDDLVAQGLSPEDARREALRQFGDLGRIRKTGERMATRLEATRERHDYLSALVQDLRYALRTFQRDRSFAAITIGILALGIAANTTVFSVVNTLLLRPLPFDQPQQLVWFVSGKAYKEQVREAAGLSMVTYTVDSYREFKELNRSFQAVAAFNPFYGNSEGTLTGRFEPRTVHGVMVTQDFFPTLGVRPLMGRNFVPEEARRGPGAIILSHAFWQRQFGGDPRLLGETVTISGTQLNVVGILPAGFDFGAVFAPGLVFDFFVPVNLDVMRAWGNTLALVGRLKPGVTLAQAQSEADVVFPGMNKTHPDWWGRYDSTLGGLQDHVSGKYRRPLMLLWAAVGLVLLIVCVNLSNLLLARTACRSREFALRTALGAGRGRVMRQLLAEGLLLSSAGAALGLGLSVVALYWISARASVALPLLSAVALDANALLWTLSIATSSAVLFGLAPAFRTASADVQDSLKEGAHGMSAGRAQERVRGVLVVAQVALACVLLTGAGLLLRSFLRVLDTDLGFQPEQASTITLDVPNVRDASKRTAFMRTVLEDIGSIPGVHAAGVADMLPLGRNRSWGLAAKGKTYPKDADVSAVVRVSTPGYLGAMGVRLVRGRDFTWADSRDSQRVVILNEAAARLRWEGEDPVGRLASINGNDATVIGIAADVKENSPETPARAEMFVPISQQLPEGAELVIRSSLPPSRLAGPVLSTLRSLNSAQPAAELRPLREIVDRAISPRRFFLVLVGSFAIMALVLAALGIYGVISYSVAGRTHEIGIRMAMGASSLVVQRSVLLSALRLTAAGVAIGSAGAYFAARSIASILYQTTPGDPLTFVWILALLAVCALMGAYFPARRASRVDPMFALRGFTDRA